MNYEPEILLKGIRPISSLHDAIFDATSFVFTHIKALLRVVLLPYIAILGILFLISEIETSAFSDMSLTIFETLSSICILFVLSVMSTAWHRFTLLTKNGQLGPTDLRFGKNEFRFFGYTLLSYFVEFPIALYSETIFSIVSPIVFLLLARFYLVFPATAIGDDVGLRDSFRITKGRTGTLIGNMLIFSFLISIIYIPVIFGLAYVLEADSILITPILTFLLTIVIAMTVSLFSFWYLWFQKNSATPAQEQQT
ncbi:MAG: hypothetical protein OEY85_03930 [Rhodospirillales bacterium]|nr:hypothetical protein [Rhodospirillales bacterium]